MLERGAAEPKTKEKAKWVKEDKSPEKKGKRTQAGYSLDRK